MSSSTNKEMLLAQEIKELKRLIEERAQKMYEFAKRHNTVLEWCAVIVAHHEEGNHDEVKKCLDNVVSSKNSMEHMQH